MSDIDFGVEWDVDSSLTAAAQTEKEGRKKMSAGPKLTPAQARDKLHNELTDAIVAEDSEKALEILADNPELSFKNGNIQKIHDALLTHFNMDVAKALVPFGQKLSVHQVRRQLMQKDNQSLLAYLLDITADEAANGRPHYVVQELYHETFNGFLAKTASARQDMFRAYRTMIEQRFPLVFNLVLENKGASQRNLFTNYASSLHDEDKTRLKNLAPLQWQEMFENYFSALQKRYAPKVGAKEVGSIVALCRDVPSAKQGWNSAIARMQDQHKTHVDFLDTYIDAEDLAHTKLVGIFARYQILPKAFGRLPPVPSTLIPKGAMTLLGLDARAQHDVALDTWTHHALGDKNGKAPPFYSIPLYAPASFVHLLVGQGMPASMALLETEEGRKLFVQCLSDRATLHKWCKNVTLDTLPAVVRACPELTTWSDEFGNSVAHYLVAVRRENTKTFAQLLARMHHPWISQKNAMGRSVKDIFAFNNPTADALAVLEHESLKRTLKDEGLIKHTRNKNVPTTKRRM